MTAGLRTGSRGSTRPSAGDCRRAAARTCGGQGARCRRRPRGPDGDAASMDARLFMLHGVDASRMVEQPFPFSGVLVRRRGTAEARREAFVQIEGPRAPCAFPHGDEPEALHPCVPQASGARMASGNRTRVGVRRTAGGAGTPSASPLPATVARLAGEPDEGSASFAESRGGSDRRGSLTRGAAPPWSRGATGAPRGRRGTRRRGRSPRAGGARRSRGFGTRSRGRRG